MRLIKKKQSKMIDEIAIQNIDDIDEQADTNDIEESETHKKHKLPSQEQINTERQRLEHRRTYRKALISSIQVLLMVAAIAVLISSLFLPVLQITGDSMEPTLKNDDIVVLVKTDKFETGDICSFSWNNRTLLKRVIGTAGDWIEIDEQGNVFVNGEKLDEPYVSNKSLGECDITFPYQVPDKSLFLMGDHRETSIDSRSSVIGSVRDDQVIGHVVLRVWPLSSFGLI